MSQEKMVCEMVGHDYVEKKVYTGGALYVCTRCGHEDHRTTLPPPVMPPVPEWDLPDPDMQPEEAFGEDYVLLEPDVTQILMSDTIELTVEGENRVLTRQKEELWAGRDVSCDLILAVYLKKIAPRHVQFHYRARRWFVMDPGTEYGTWLNGQRLQPGKKYQLQRNDVIDLAHEKRLIFFRMESKRPEPVKQQVSMEPNPKNLQGEVLCGRYEMLAPVGRGGMSWVYLAVDRRLNKSWAVKLYDKTQKHYSPEFAQHILWEFQEIARLNHPGIPAVVDIFETTRYTGIVMDYVHGSTLDLVLERNGPQSVEQVLKWGVELCDVLGYLHSRKPARIHRDIKPANLILQPDGSLKLIDFGTMRFYDPDAKADDVCLGTIGYAAPEQFGGMGQTDARTDIYALGVTLYQLLTGQDPTRPPYQILPIREVNPQLPEKLEKIILKCIARDRKDRYQSCEELKYALLAEEYPAPHKGFFRRLFGKK